MTIDNEFIARVTAYTVQQIETRLREAHLIATNARSYSAQDLDDRAIETLLDVEPLIYEAKMLLEAVTIFRRGRSL